MNITICKSYEQMGKVAAGIIAGEILKNPKCVLGLATGSTPVSTYKELIRMYNDKILDFSKVTSFNLDEYYGINKSNDQSYYYFMRENLFDHINIENTNIPDGMTDNPQKECAGYDKKIKEYGIDVQILGIGVNGHIGFNEPDSVFIKETHIVELTKETIASNARFFKSIEEVPTKALTMGIGAIMNAKSVILLANGEAKADCIYKMVKGQVDPNVPASILQLHKNLTVIIDENAAKKLN